MPSSNSRIDDIEALRAVAILFTLLTHMNGLFPWAPHWLIMKVTYFNFATGVDLFFAVSGFVIARDLLPRLAAAETTEAIWRTMLAFWTRRVYRIWPSSILWILVICVCSVVFASSGLFHPLHSNVGDLSAIVLQVANFHYWHCLQPGMWDCGDSVVWWSLSLEEQFYILLPLAAVLFRKRLTWFLGAVVLAQLFLHRPAFADSVLWWVRTDALCLGVLLAFFEKSPLYRVFEPTFLADRKYGVPVILAIIAMLALGSGSPGKVDSAFFSTGLIALISALLVFIASYNRGYITSSRAMRHIVLWIGSRSFALYLIHFTAISLTIILWRHIEPAGTVFGARFGLRYAITWVVMTCVLAELNYRFVETPLRNKGKQIARRIENATAAG